MTGPWAGAKPGTGEPDGSDPDRFSILFVCTGNICRSPVAEYLTRAALSIRLGPAAGQVPVTSAGTWGHEGAAMEPFALQVLAERGIDGTEFRARELDAQMVAAADLVLAATREHRAGAVVLYPRASARVFTLREFDRLTASVDPAELPDSVVARGRALVRQAAGRRGLAPPATAGDDDVPDPYGAPLAIFRRCADEIIAVLRGPVDRLARPAPPMPATSSAPHVSPGSADGFAAVE